MLVFTVLFLIPIIVYGILLRILRPHLIVWRLVLPWVGILFIYVATTILLETIVNDPWDALDISLLGLLSMIILFPLLCGMVLHATEKYYSFIILIYLYLNLYLGADSNHDFLPLYPTALLLPLVYLVLFYIGLGIATLYSRKTMSGSFAGRIISYIVLTITAVSWILAALETY